VLVIDSTASSNIAAENEEQQASMDSNESRNGAALNSSLLSPLSSSAIDAAAVFLATEEAALPSDSNSNFGAAMEPVSSAAAAPASQSAAVMAVGGNIESATAGIATPQLLSLLPPSIPTQQDGTSCTKGGRVGDLQQHGAAAVASAQPIVASTGDHENETSMASMQARMAIMERHIN
jgi:hypothetical protein